VLLRADTRGKKVLRFPKKLVKKGEGRKCPVGCKGRGWGKGGFGHRLLWFKEVLGKRGNKVQGWSGPTGFWKKKGGETNLGGKNVVSGSFVDV